MSFIGVKPFICDIVTIWELANWKPKPFRDKDHEDIRIIKPSTSPLGFPAKEIYAKTTIMGLPHERPKL